MNQYIDHNMHDIISQLNFDPKNPFDLDTDIVPDRFIQGFYNEYLLHCYSDEYFTTILYPAILNNLKTKQYEQYIGSFNQQEREQLYQYFDKMIQDETEHTDQFLIMLNKINPQDVDLNWLKQKSQSMIENTDLVKLLSKVYVRECYVWVSFFQIYKTSTSDDKKRIFKKLLVEESQHNNNILKFLKKIKQTTVALTKDEYIDFVKEDRLMNLLYIQHECKIPDANSAAFKKVVQFVYNNAWHDKFNELLIKKTYQLSAVLFPEITFEEFKSAVNG